ncbi:hypothetical protein FHT26_001169 [Rhizobacter sp. SG703]|nr:hypothetical protein [Rhizobacter sp. SG703]
MATGTSGAFVPADSSTIRFVLPTNDPFLTWAQTGAIFKAGGLQAAGPVQHQPAGLPGVHARPCPGRAARGPVLGLHRPRAGHLPLKDRIAMTKTRKLTLSLWMALGAATVPSAGTFPRARRII